MSAVPRIEAQARQHFRFSDAPRSTVAGELHEQVTQRIVERLDVP